MTGMGPNFDPESAPDVPGASWGDADLHAGPVGSDGTDEGSSEETDLAELVSQLGPDPAEWTRAAEGLEALDPVTRVRIIGGLRRLPRGPGVDGLLRLLAVSGTPEIRAAAGEALGPAGELVPLSSGGEPGRSLDRAGTEMGPRPMRGLVTGVDGDGRATIGLSSTHAGGRRTALFRCDVGRGITGAVGVLEPEGEGAGGLLDELRGDVGVTAVVDATALAVGLLAGCLWLSRSAPGDEVRRWLDATVGPGLRPRPFLISVAAGEERPGPGASADEPQWSAIRILEECPTWLDRSPLTFELAEEIVLREGHVAADLRRDAGAIRYLFEHRILGRLELYRRMLFWMARCWEASGRDDLAQSADRFAIELSDEQFAVPGHPFAQALAARSLDAAGEALGTAADPRTRVREG